MERDKTGVGDRMITENIGSKTCSKCGITKPYTDFFRQDSGDTYRSQCKKCVGEYAKNYRKNNSEKRRSYNRKYYADNIVKSRERGREEQRRRRENGKQQKYRRVYNRTTGYFTTLKRRYGISISDFIELWVRQDRGKCAICHIQMVVCSGKSYNTVSVDHNHDTGKVRGLLCHKCNRHMWLFEKYPVNVASYFGYKIVGEGYGY